VVFAGVICGQLGCRAQQNFPGAAHAGAQASVALQLFEPPSSRLDDRHTLTDLSSLSPEPAGTHGFVRGSLGHFVDDRGSRLRFFGVNLSGIACLPDRETAPRLARHLRKLGFNAVRLRGLDGEGVLLEADGQIAPAALAQLDYFMAALKAEGLYFSLVLHESGGYPTLSAEAKQRFARGKVLDRFHPAFLEAQRDFAGRLLRHRNAETGLEYRAEPALLYVELSHEDTIFPSSSGDPDDVPADFRAELAKGYAPWIAQRTAEGLRAPGPADEEAKAELPTLRGSSAASADFALYLREIEHTSVVSLIKFIREELGLKSMLINSQASFGGLAGVLREAELSDFIDMHGYWSDTARSQINATDAGALGTLASYRVFGKPFVVSEYASVSNDYAAEMFPLLAGIAGLQDWDAVFAFAYADQKREYQPTRINGLFDLAGHPAKLAFLSTAAAAFRRGLVAPALTRIELGVPEQPNTLPFGEGALVDIWSKLGVSMTEAATRQLGIALRPGPGQITVSNAPRRTAGPVGSDTGELLWEAGGKHARFSIDAPQLKAVCGFLSDSALEFSGVRFHFDSFSPGFACASLLALDQAPLENARQLLFTVSGLARNSSSSPSLSELALAQYVPITVTLQRDAWRAEALDAAGMPTHTVPIVNGVASTFSTSYQGAALSYAFTR